MIRITPQPEPAIFDADVRQKGNDFLRCCSNPSKKDWRSHTYWQKVSQEIYDAYQKICAYTGRWFARTESSIDHFLPKSCYPHLAYEWCNYRLATQRVNGDKGDDGNIVDPFVVQEGWFVLDFPSCFVKVGQTTTNNERLQIQHTIDTLKLNHSDYIDEREEIVQAYMDGAMPFNGMKEKFPFVAFELRRQNLIDVGDLRMIFKRK